MTLVPNPMQVFQKTRQVSSQSQTSGKYFDNKIMRDTKNSNSIVTKNKTGGDKISRAIAMDYDTYHKTKGR